MSCAQARGPQRHGSAPAPDLRRLVRQQRVLRRLLALRAGLELGKVAVVVALRTQGPARGIQRVGPG